MIPTSNINAQAAGTVIRCIKGEFDKKLGYLLDGLAVNVADALFEEMWGLDEKEALEYHFNVMRALKEHTAAYRQEFDRLMNETWRIFLRSRDNPPVETPTGVAGKLMTSYRDSFESHHKLLLTDVRLRLSCILKSQLHHYPLQPGNLYLCFWHSIEKLGLNDDERVLLIPLFQRFVMARYGQVLGAVNKILIAHSIGTFGDDI